MTKLKKLLAVSITSAGLMMGSSSANATYSVVDGSHISTALANSAAEIAEMVKTHGLLNQDMLQDAMQHAEKILRDQMNQQADILYSSQSDANMMNKKTMNGLKTATGLCAAKSMSEKMKDIECEKTEKKESDSKKFSAKRSGKNTSDNQTTQREKEEQLLSHIEAVNKAAADAGSDLTVETVMAAITSGRELTPEEFELYKTAVEEVMIREKKAPQEEFNEIGSPAYNEQRLRQLRESQYVSLARDAMMDIAYNNVKTENGEGPSKNNLERKFLGQWYGEQEKDGQITVGASVHMSAIMNAFTPGEIDETTGKPAKAHTVDQAIREGVLLQGINNWQQQIIIEQGKRIEQLLAAKLMYEINGGD
ncbi:hypothetical protein ACMXYX_18180 (plasmid) [Neptuniibacter sp. QD72_48]|uniref:hypothetical protein n=1 Tax=Neptuniibacter sp. QD72_48 TaxID=3398214 RepID=UPI0039F57D31